MVTFWLPEGVLGDLGGGKVPTRKGRRHEKEHQRTRDEEAGDLGEPKDRLKGTQREPRVARKVPRRPYVGVSWCAQGRWEPRLIQETNEKHRRTPKSFPKAHEHTYHKSLAPQRTPK